MREYEINNSATQFARFACLSRSVCPVARLTRESKECDGNAADYDNATDENGKQTSEKCFIKQIQMIYFYRFACMCVWMCVRAHDTRGIFVIRFSANFHETEYKISSYGNGRVDESIKSGTVSFYNSFALTAYKPLGARFIKNFWHWRNVSVHDGNNGSTHTQIMNIRHIEWHRWTTNRPAWDHRVQSAEE